MAHFYLKDVTHTDPYRKEKIEKDVLHFHFSDSYDDRADAQNVINHKSLYSKFASENPGYRLPEAWTKANKHEYNEQILSLKAQEGVKKAAPVEVEEKKVTKK